MERLETRLEGPALLAPNVFGDARGFFAETYREETLAGLGISERWVQDNHSRSAGKVIRGMHFQGGQAKLVRCARGSMVDVLVDIRKGSPTFGEWEAFPLDDEGLRILYCPPGFAHGFCVTSESADVVYKCSEYYDAAGEMGIAYDDPDVGIEWPVSDPVVSERDSGAPRLSEVADELPFTYGE